MCGSIFSIKFGTFGHCYFKKMSLLPSPLLLLLPFTCWRAACCGGSLGVGLCFSSFLPSVLQTGHFLWRYRQVHRGFFCHLESAIEAFQGMFFVISNIFLSISTVRLWLFFPHNLCLLISNLCADSLPSYFPLVL